ncbi:MAG: trypsin-like serine protease, partial [Steroidobacteraceae bacterium]
MTKVSGLLALACLVSLEAGAAPAAVSQQSILDRLDKAGLSSAQRAEIERAITDSQVLVLRNQKASESRVVNGEPAADGQFPWMVALLVEDSFGNRFQFCGGSLIAPNRVLTAAHCNIYRRAAVRVMVNEI